MTGPTVGSIFRRYDVSPADSSISKGELEVMVRQSGVPVFGDEWVDKSTDLMIRILDSDDDGAASQTELHEALRTLLTDFLPPPEEGHQDDRPAERAMEWFDLVDRNDDRHVSYGELQSELQRQLEDAGIDDPDIVGGVISKILLVLIDESGVKDANGNYIVSREQMASIVNDVMADPPAQEAGHVLEARLTSMGV
jgi:Ca2+-binding EF-hand superfamily protein